MITSRNLEIHVVDHCNLDCVGCSHDSPLMRRRSEDVLALEQCLTNLWRFYQTPLVKLLGGEPLLHPRLTEIIDVVKRTTAARVRVVTNGTLIERLFRSLIGVDEIHVSSYPQVPQPSDERLRDISAELNASITIQSFDAFRWPRSIEREDDSLTQRVFHSCQMFHRWECHTLRAGRFFPCPPIATWAESLEQGIDLLSDVEMLGDRLQQTLTRPHAFAACASCLGSVGKLFPHKQGWRRLPQSELELGIDLEFLQRLETSPDGYNDCLRL